jgi:hypothetical protein
MPDQMFWWAWGNARIFEEFHADQINFFGVNSRSRTLGKYQDRALNLGIVSSFAIALGVAGEFLLSRIEEPVT